MEVRINDHGPNSLSTKVFFSNEKGFEVASVIAMGKTNAVLIDAHWTLSNAHRVIAEITETGKHLETIFVTHAHPDHYFGLGVIAEAFPSARVTAYLRGYGGRTSAMDTGYRALRKDGCGGDHSWPSETWHAFRFLFMHVYEGLPNGHRRGIGQNQRRGLLLLRHGSTLPGRQPFYQQRNERRRLQRRQRLELERRVR